MFHDELDDRIHAEISSQAAYPYRTGGKTRNAQSAISRRWQCGNPYPAGHPALEGDEAAGTRPTYKRP